MEKKKRKKRKKQRGKQYQEMEHSRISFFRKKLHEWNDASTRTSKLASTYLVDNINTLRKV